MHRAFGYIMFSPEFCYIFSFQYASLLAKKRSKNAAKTFFSLSFEARNLVAAMSVLASLTFRLRIFIMIFNPLLIGANF